MKKAFTLIEMMITIALLAMMLGASMEMMGSSQALRRQKEMLSASRQAEKQLRRLQSIPFENLPPQILKPDSQGWIQLGQPDLEKESLQLQPLEGDLAGLKVENLEVETGRLRVNSKWAGRPISLNYSCYLCDQGETHRLGADARLELENSPPRRIERILRARGDELSPFQDWSFQAQTGLRLGPSARGQVLMIDYRGGLRANRLSGRFVDEQLRVQTAPSNFKLLRLEETFAGHARLTVSSLKVAP